MTLYEFPWTLTANLRFHCFTLSPLHVNYTDNPPYLLVLGRGDRNSSRNSVGDIWG